MTQPGYVAPTSPGWWVRSHRVGTAESEYDWGSTVTGLRQPAGLAAGRYRWAITAAGIGLDPMTFDSASNGDMVDSGPLTWTHTTVAAADLFAAVVNFNNTAIVTGITVTCDGSPMTLVPGAVQNNDNTVAKGATQIFRATGLAAGVHTIAVSQSSGTDALAGASVAYNNVSAAVLGGAVTGGASPLSQVAAISGAQRIVQVFGAVSGTFMTLTYGSGGVNRTANAVGSRLARVLIDEASTDATFAATGGAIGGWTGIYLLLS